MSLRDLISRIRAKKQHKTSPGASGVKPKPYVIHLRDAYAKCWSDCPCVFVLSTGRVGTRTFAALLDLSPDVLALHEPEPRLLKPSFDIYLEGCDASIPKWSYLVRIARDDFIVRANCLGKVYVETSNKLTFFAYALADAFPASRFIHLHRDPYEVIKSGMRRKWYNGHAEDFARPRPRESDRTTERWESMDRIEKIAWLWSETNAWIMEFSSYISSDRLIHIGSQDLFALSPSIIDKIFQFIPARAPQLTQIKEVMAQKLNAQINGSCEELDNLPDGLRRSVRSIVSETALRLGYTV